eukprot:tig00000880_g5166.t1
MNEGNACYAIAVVHCISTIQAIVAALGTENWQGGVAGQLRELVCEGRPNGGGGVHSCQELKRAVAAADAASDSPPRSPWKSPFWGATQQDAYLFFVKMCQELPKAVQAAYTFGVRRDRRCERCKYTSAVFEEQGDIPGELPQSSGAPTRSSTLDLLRRYFKADKFEWTCCSGCKLKTDGKVLTRLDVSTRDGKGQPRAPLPPALVVHVGRWTPGKDARKRDDPVYPDKRIDLTKLGENAFYPNVPEPGSATYTLRAVLRHHGLTLDGGHYTVDVLWNGNWSRRRRPQVMESEVLGGGGDAYMLFYEREEHVGGAPGPSASSPGPSPPAVAPASPSYADAVRGPRAAEPAAAPEQAAAGPPAAPAPAQAGSQAGSQAAAPAPKRGRPAPAKAAAAAAEEEEEAASAAAQASSQAAAPAPKRGRPASKADTAAAAEDAPPTEWAACDRAVLLHGPPRGHLQDPEDRLDDDEEDIIADSAQAAAAPEAATQASSPAAPASPAAPKKRSRRSKATGAAAAPEQAAAGSPAAPEAATQASSPAAPASPAAPKKRSQRSKATGAAAAPEQAAAGSPAAPEAATQASSPAAPASPAAPKKRSRRSKATGAAAAPEQAAAGLPAAPEAATQASSPAAPAGPAAPKKRRRQQAAEATGAAASPGTGQDPVEGSEGEKVAHSEGSGQEKGGGQEQQQEKEKKGKQRSTLDRHDAQARPLSRPHRPPARPRLPDQRRTPAAAAQRKEHSLARKRKSEKQNTKERKEKAKKGETARAEAKAVDAEATPAAKSEAPDPSPAPTRPDKALSEEEEEVLGKKGRARMQAAKEHLKRRREAAAAGEGADGKGEEGQSAKKKKKKNKKKSNNKKPPQRCGGCGEAFADEDYAVTPSGHRRLKIAEGHILQCAAGGDGEGDTHHAHHARCANLCGRFKGVRRDGDTWTATARVAGLRSEWAAARAFDRLVIAVHGPEKARDLTNFPPEHYKSQCFFRGRIPGREERPAASCSLEEIAEAVGAFGRAEDEALAKCEEDERAEAARLAAAKSPSFEVDKARRALKKKREDAARFVAMRLQHFEDAMGAWPSGRKKRARREARTQAKKEGIQKCADVWVEKAAARLAAAEARMAAAAAEAAPGPGGRRGGRRSPWYCPCHRLEPGKGPQAVAADVEKTQKLAIKEGDVLPALVTVAERTGFVWGMAAAARRGTLTFFNERVKEALKYVRAASRSRPPGLMPLEPCKGSMVKIFPPEGGPKCRRCTPEAKFANMRQLAGHTRRCHEGAALDFPGPFASSHRLLANLPYTNEIHEVRDRGKMPPRPEGGYAGASFIIDAILKQLDGLAPRAEQEGDLYDTARTRDAKTRRTEDGGKVAQAETTELSWWACEKCGEECHTRSGLKAHKPACPSKKSKVSLSFFLGGGGGGGGEGREGRGWRGKRARGDDEEQDDDDDGGSGANEGEEAKEGAQAPTACRRRFLHTETEEEKQSVRDAVEAAATAYNGYRFVTLSFRKQILDLVPAQRRAALRIIIANKESPRDKSKTGLRLALEQIRREFAEERDRERRKEDPGCGKKTDASDVLKSKVLDAIEEQRPTSVDGLIACKVPRAKAASAFGKRLLECVSSHAAGAQSKAPAPVPATPPAAPAPPASPPAGGAGKKAGGARGPTGKKAKGTSQRTSQGTTRPPARTARRPPAPPPLPVEEMRKMRDAYIRTLPPGQWDRSMKADSAIRGIALDDYLAALQRQFERHKPVAQLSPRNWHTRERMSAGVSGFTYNQPNSAFWKDFKKMWTHEGKMPDKIDHDSRLVLERSGRAWFCEPCAPKETRAAKRGGAAGYARATAKEIKLRGGRLIALDPGRGAMRLHLTHLRERGRPPGTGLPAEAEAVDDSHIRVVFDKDSFAAGESVSGQIYVSLTCKKSIQEIRVLPVAIYLFDPPKGTKRLPGFTDKSPETGVAAAPLGDCISLGKDEIKWNYHHEHYVRTMAGAPVGPLEAVHEERIEYDFPFSFTLPAKLHPTFTRFGGFTAKYAAVVSVDRMKPGAEPGAPALATVTAPHYFAVHVPDSAAEKVEPPKAGGANVTKAFGAMSMNLAARLSTPTPDPGATCVLYIDLANWSRRKVTDFVLRVKEIAKVEAMGYKFGRERAVLERKFAAAFEGQVGGNAYAKKSLALDVRVPPQARPFASSFLELKWVIEVAALLDGTDESVELQLPLVTSAVFVNLPRAPGAVPSNPPSSPPSSSAPSPSRSLPPRPPPAPRLCSRRGRRGGPGAGAGAGAGASKAVKSRSSSGSAPASQASLAPAPEEEAAAAQAKPKGGIRFSEGTAGGDGEAGGAGREGGLAGMGHSVKAGRFLNLDLAAIGAAAGAGPARSEEEKEEEAGEAPKTGRAKKSARFAAAGGEERNRSFLKPGGGTSRRSDGSATDRSQFSIRVNQSKSEEHLAKGTGKAPAQAPASKFQKMAGLLRMAAKIEHDKKAEAAAAGGDGAEKPPEKSKSIRGVLAALIQRKARRDEEGEEGGYRSVKSTRSSRSVKSAKSVKASKSSKSVKLARPAAGEAEGEEEEEAGSPGPGSLSASPSAKGSPLKGAPGADFPEPPPPHAPGAPPHRPESASAASAASGRPASAASARPGSAASARPPSAASARPGSAASVRPASAASAPPPPPQPQPQPEAQAAGERPKGWLLKAFSAAAKALEAAEAGAGRRGGRGEEEDLEAGVVQDDDDGAFERAVARAEGTRPAPPPPSPGTRPRRPLIEEDEEEEEAAAVVAAAEEEEAPGPWEAPEAPLEGAGAAFGEEGAAGAGLFGSPGVGERRRPASAMARSASVPSSPSPRPAAGPERPRAPPSRPASPARPAAPAARCGPAAREPERGAPGLAAPPLPRMRDCCERKPSVPRQALSPEREARRYRLGAEAWPDYEEELRAIAGQEWAPEPREGARGRRALVSAQALAAVLGMQLAEVEAVLLGPRPAERPPPHPAHRFGAYGPRWHVWEVSAREQEAGAARRYQVRNFDEVRGVYAAASSRARRRLLTAPAAYPAMGHSPSGLSLAASASAASLLEPTRGHARASLSRPGTAGKARGGEAQLYGVGQPHAHHASAAQLRPASAGARPPAPLAASRSASTPVLIGGWGRHLP